MDYSNYRCPVCEKPFVNDSEIVVPAGGYVKLDKENNIVKTWEGVQ